MGFVILTHLGNFEIFTWVLTRLSASKPASPVKRMAVEEKAFSDTPAPQLEDEGILSHVDHSIIESSRRRPKLVRSFCSSGFAPWVGVSRSAHEM